MRAYVLEEQSIGKTARLLGSAVGSTKSHLYRARSELARSLAKSSIRRDGMRRISAVESRV
jgi:DNA-directed RNA polymerase specialized sigma24 family protein